ncbi:MAG: 30S ribosomal protein S12 methylthiotransferase RimO [Clostridiales bacterium]|nr:30S ribosomal protein S12 methylthiotransferase RimO [Clostridiales bacterium]
MNTATNDSDNKKSKKVAFISLGCDKNLVDSEVMLGIIDQAGYTIISDERDAEIIIVNTCGFILDATNEGIENVITAGEYKKNGKCKTLIVTGCMAQRYRDEIFDELPEVDAVVGTGDFESIARVIEEAGKGNKVKAVTDINNLINENNSLNRVLSTPPYFAYLKIAEGCDNFCTYCTIPSLRGKYRSRHMESLVKEAQILCEKGVRELILVAQDTALYGRDLYGEPKLHELMNKLSEIEDLEWIRLLYCYPENITEGMIKEMAVNPKVCHYIDMPVQHGDDYVLKKMGRKGMRKDIKNIVGKLRKAMPDIAIRTTLIVGFPGETQENFDNLTDFVEEIAFDRLGIFIYSKEDGTPAAILPDQIDEEIKASRKDYITEVQKNISAKKCKAQKGKVFKVLVEGKLSEEDVYCGRTYMDCYEIDGMVFFESDEDIIAGEFRNVLITDSSDYDLIGVVQVEPAK